jgi:hypothetical protein
MDSLSRLRDQGSTATTQTAALRSSHVLQRQTSQQHSMQQQLQQQHLLDLSCPARGGLVARSWWCLQADGELQTPCRTLQLQLQQQQWVQVPELCTVMPAASAAG